METFWLYLVVCLLLVMRAQAYPPHDISNFQNEFVCDSSVRLVRPLSVSDVKEAIRRHTYIKALGGGFSWNKFLCSFNPRRTLEEHDTSANIVMTTIRPMTIEINEEEMYAWVSAGVVIWDLMEYLGHYNTPSAPRGYALGSTPALVNQTIAGAIATGTHASSLTHGSLSNQVIGFRVVLANGTTTEIYPHNYPLYFRAFQVNVGRLGVVTDVKMRIIKERLVRRTTVLGVAPEEVVRRLKGAQETFRSTGVVPDWLDGTWLNWNPIDGTFMVFNTRDEKPEKTADYSGVEDSDDFLDHVLNHRINGPINLSRTENGGDIADGVTWEYPVPFPSNPLLADLSNIPAFNAQVEDTFTNPTNTSLETHVASLSQPFYPSLDPIRMSLLDGYEVSFPAERMADCVEGALELLESQRPDTGLRGYALLRVVKRENGLLALTNDQPRMYLIMDELIYYNRGRRSNVPFKNLMAYLVTSPSCAPARLHWAKPGWPDPGCWNGAEYYPNTWCDFGCAVRDLDPTNKFMSDLPEVWNWEGANLDKCCTPDGYDKTIDGCKCAVVSQRDPHECPQAPFFSNR